MVHQNHYPALFHTGCGWSACPSGPFDHTVCVATVCVATMCVATVCVTTVRMATVCDPPHPLRPQQPTMLLRLIFLLLPLLASSTKFLSCKDVSNNDVDWWTALNIGTASQAANVTLGTAAAYFDANSPTWHWSTVTSSEEAQKSSLYYTTTQLPYMGGSAKNGYIVFNDQWCEVRRALFSRTGAPGAFWAGRVVRIANCSFYVHTVCVAPLSSSLTLVQCPPGASCVSKKLSDGTTCPTYDTSTDRCHCNETPHDPNHDKDSRGNKRYDAPDKHGDAYAHAKGFLIFNQYQGIYVSHSTPGFPMNEEYYKETGWAWSKSQYNQHFNCVTLTPRGVEQLAQGFIVNNVLPQRDSHHVPAALRDQYPVASKLDVKDGAGLNVPDAYEFVGGTSQVKLYSKGGLEMEAFSKQGSLKEEYQTDLWDDLVAPGLETDFYVETWCNGGFSTPRKTMEQCESGKDSLCGGECVCEAEEQSDYDVYFCQASSCDNEFKVQQITMLDLSGYTVKDRHIKSMSSHNKWAISQNADSPYVCFGDINRQASQRKRGGGAICMKSPQHHRIMSKWVRHADECV